MPDPIQPPVPFDDFTYAFDPAVHSIFPSPPPLPSSADLFSQSETTDLLGFLEHFNWDWDAEAQDGTIPSEHHAHKPHPPSLSLHTAITHSMSGQGHDQDVGAPSTTFEHPDVSPQDTNDQQRYSQSPTSPVSPTSEGTPQLGGSRNPRYPKPLLSTPQKRLNHIMSEQKRRNAIRDGYAQLTTLLAPAGAPPGAGMPTRGRPKGSGSRANGGSKRGGFKGKSGILFRAVEYIQWLEEGREALLEEVRKVEAAAGIRSA